MGISIELWAEESDDMLASLLDMRRDMGFSNFRVEIRGGASTISFDAPSTTDLQELASDLNLPQHKVQGN